MRDRLRISMGGACLALAVSAAAAGMTGQAASAPLREASSEERVAEPAMAVGPKLDQKALRAYLAALDRVSLEIELGIGGAGPDPNDLSRLGPILARRGVTLEIEATFDGEGMDPADRELGPRIRALRIEPGRGVGSEKEAFQFGPLHIKGLWLGDAGELCLGMDVRFVKVFPNELCIASIQRCDASGECLEESNRPPGAPAPAGYDYLVFNSTRKGRLAGLVPEMRINPEGVVERFKRKGFWFIKWDGSWKPVKDDAPRLEMPLPIHDWPIHLPDLLDWLPVVSRAGAGDEPDSGVEPSRTAEAPRAPLSIPLSRFFLSFESSMDHGEVPLEEPAGKLVFSNHAIDLKVDGSFTGGVFRTAADRESSLSAKWTVAGTVDEESLARVDIGAITVDLDGSLEAEFDFENLDRREAEVRFDAGIDLDLSALEVRTEEGLAIALPHGLRGKVSGLGAARLVPGIEQPQIALSRESGLMLRVPGPIVLTRPKKSRLPVMLELPGELTLTSASTDKPLLSVDGSLGTSSDNLVFADASFELDGVGGEAFGLRAGPGLELRMEPGSGIGLAGAAQAEAGLGGLERLAGARFDLALRMPGGGGELRVLTKGGMPLGGRLRGGSAISIGTGPMAPAGASAIATQGAGGTIEGDLGLRMGKGGIPSAVTGAAELDLGGRFRLRLDPARRKETPPSFLDGPIRAALSLGLGLQPGAEYRPPGSPAPVVFKTPMRLDLALAGEFGAGADSAGLEAVEVSVEGPIGLGIEMKPR